MLRDRIVVGIRDSAMSERLQLDPDLNLEKAMKLVRQREAVHEGQLALKGTDPPVNLDETKEKKPQKKPAWSGHRGNKPHPMRKKRCTRCGKEPAHPKDKCPARDAICHSCKKKGHYAVLHENPQ